MKTLNNNIVCQEVDKTVDPKSSVIIPELEKKYKTLEVFVPDNDGNCKKGDIIYVPFRSATKVKVEGKDYQIVNKRDIMFIV